jgi:hypothetical protein
MPIWAQFQGIPYYLLSKHLARRLGRKLGDLIVIDNYSRGDLNDKILHAKVDLLVARALQRWVTLEDEISDEEVCVNVSYERLPSFCTCCGVIGHLEPACDLPRALRKTRYSTDLGVPATHADDPRKWYLAESACENGRAVRTDLPWRNVARLGARPVLAPKEQLAMVASVANEVEKLSVKEPESNSENAKAIVDSTLDATAPASSPTASSTIPKAIIEPKEADTNTINIAATADQTDAEARDKKQWKRRTRDMPQKLTRPRPLLGMFQARHTRCRSWAKGLNRRI